VQAAALLGYAKIQDVLQKAKPVRR